MKACLYLFLTLLISLTGLRAADNASAKSLSFDLKGKTRERNGKHEFWLPHPEGPFSILILPEDPWKLCARSSPEGAAAMKEREGLAVGRYHIVGKCVADPSGKFHVITSVEKMLPLGPGVVRTEERTITGKLEVRGDANAEDWRNKSDMIVHGVDGTSYRIPAKKFDSKPSGLDYQHAAKLNQQKIQMKANVQIFPELPHRIATVHHFEKAAGPEAK